MGEQRSEGKLAVEVDRLNEALKQLSFQNQMLLGWVNGSVLTVDKDGHVLHANDVALADIGWTLEELVGRHMHETMHHSQDDGSEYPWEFSPVFAAIEDGSSHHVDGDVFWQRDGTSFKVDYIVSPTRDERNLITGAILIFRNLTAQKLYETKRIHGMKLESIGELSAGIAHEINTPIQFIGNNVAFLEESFSDVLNIVKASQLLFEKLREKEIFLDMLANLQELIDIADMEYLDEEIPKAFSQTLDGVDRVTKLVLGLKAFAHSSNDEIKKVANINEIIQNALIVSQNAYKYVADLVTEYGEIPEIPVLSQDIGQVVVNLVVNASHAIEEKNRENGKRGTISIKTFQKQNEIVILVKDTGIGIAEKLKPRIFDPFFTTKDVGKGSGQGLAICRTIICEKHAGDIGLDSVVGEGTTFFIRLPIH